MKSHGMFAGGDAGAGEVGDEALFDGHLAEGGLGFLLGKIVEQGAGGASGVLDLPEGVAAVGDFAERVESSDFGEQGEVGFAQRGDAGDEVLDGGEGAGGDEVERGVFAHAAGVVEAEAEGEVRGRRMWAISWRVPTGEKLWGWAGWYPTSANSGQRWGTRGCLSAGRKIIDGGGK